MIYYLASVATATAAEDFIVYADSRWAAEKIIAEFAPEAVTFVHRVTLYGMPSGFERRVTEEITAR